LAKFPEPPSAEALAKIPPEIRQIPVGGVLWRLYFRGGQYPNFWNTFRAFGPTDARFDHQLPPPRLQMRRILYGALEGPTCLAEVFQSTRMIDRAEHEPWLVGFELTQPLVLLDLSGVWPTRAGASMAINTGQRPRARRWAQAIYEAYPEVQGLFYPSSMHGNRSAVTLWERGAGAVPPMPVFHRPLLDPALLPVLSRVARDIAYGLV
jgi:hypothetical protein